MSCDLVSCDLILYFLTLSWFFERLEMPKILVMLERLEILDILEKL